MTYTKFIPLDNHSTGRSRHDSYRNFDSYNPSFANTSAEVNKAVHYDDRRTLIRQLMPVSEPLNLERGGLALSYTDQNHYCYDVVDGVMALSKIGARDSKQIIHFSFGSDLIPLFEHSDGYEIRALTDVSFVKYRLSDLNKTLSQSAHLGSVFWRYSQGILSSQMKHIHAIGQYTSLKRVAYFLLEVHRRQSQKDRSSLRLMHPITRQDVSNYLGITIETTSRCFSKLKSDGLIYFKNSQETQILDLGALKGLLN